MPGEPEAVRASSGALRMSHLVAGNFILQAARIYSDASEKVPGWRSAVGLYCKFNRCAV